MIIEKPVEFALGTRVKDLDEILMKIMTISFNFVEYNSDNKLAVS